MASLQELLQQEPITILDVRAPDEYAMGFIPTSSNVPLGALARYTGVLSTNQQVVIHCQGGTRSAIGASLLAAQGYTTVLNLSGGFQAWQEAGAVVERPPQGTTA